VIGLSGYTTEAEIGHGLPSGMVWNNVASATSTTWSGSPLTVFPSAMTETVYAGVADEHLLKQGGGVQHWPARKI
jgi:hypothetical protein